MAQLKTIQLPPMSPDIIKYMDAVPLIPSQIQNAISVNQLMIQNLSVLSQRFKTIIMKEGKSIIDTNRLKAQKFTSSNNAYIFARKKFLKIFMKYHLKKNEMYQMQYGVVVKMMKFLQDAVNLKSPLIFKEKLFMKNIKPEETDEMKKLSDKILRLQTYAKTRQNEATTQKILPKELLVILGHEAAKVDDKINYVPVNSFDESFTIFTHQSGLIRKFSQFTKQMPVFPKKKTIKISRSSSLGLSDQITPEQNQMYLPTFEEMHKLQQANDEFSEQTSDEKDQQDNEQLYTSNIFDSQLPTFNEDTAKNEELGISFGSTIGLGQMVIAPPTEFDFDKNENGDEEAEEVVPVQKQKFNLKEFNTFVQFFFIALNSDQMGNKSYFAVMKSAALRILFDTYYLENEAILVGPKCNVKFILACEKTLKKTPRELGISHHLTLDENQDVPMLDLLKKSKHFIMATENLILLDFYTNPMDVAYVAYCSIKEIEDGIREITGKSGPLEMSNDDLFGFLVSCFSVNPVGSPTTFNRFLNLFDDMRLSNNLQYASICLKTVVSYLLEDE